MVVRHPSRWVAIVAALAFAFSALAAFSIVSDSVLPPAVRALGTASPQGRGPIDCWDHDVDGMKDRLFGSDQQLMPNLVSFGGGAVRGGGGGDPCDGDLADCSALGPLTDVSLELAWNGGKSYFYRIDNSLSFSTWLEGIPDPDLFEACIDSVVREWKLEGNAYPTASPVDSVWSGSGPYVELSGFSDLLDFLNDYFVKTTLIETYTLVGGGTLTVTYLPPPP